MWLPDTPQDHDDRVAEIERDWHRDGMLLGEYVAEALTNTSVATRASVTSSSAAYRSGAAAIRSASACILFRDDCDPPCVAMKQMRQLPSTSLQITSESPSPY